MISRHSRRSGFTLLEVLLASTLALILMAALYVALDVQLRLAADGRDAIDQATLTRAILQRFENDLGSSIGPVAPPVGNQGGSSGGGSSSGGAGGSTTGEAVVEVVASTDASIFEAGIIGESDGENRPRLTMFVARVASAQTGGEPSDSASPADIRRVTYWMTDVGLARQEIPWLTSERVQSTTEPDIEDGRDESSYVIAPEVIRLVIEYWDGSGWLETWDGREKNSDGKTVRGPPMAIRIRFWLSVPGPEPGEMIEKEFRHTIAVRSAPGPAVPETPAPPAESTPMP